MSDNPLEQFYRTKEIYITLPTGGEYFTEKPEFTADGEIGIMPMNLKDETLLKIPDTLFNGEAIYNIVKSVAPDIKDPYEITIPDLDVILLATRSATYGGLMPLMAVCPHCSKQAEYEIDLTTLLSQIISVSTDKEIQLGDLLVKVKPNTVKVVTAMGISQIKSHQIAMEINKDNDNQGVTPEIRKMFDDSLNEVAACDLAIIADGIDNVRLPDGTVVEDFSQIMAWLTNSNSNNISKIRKFASEQNKNGLPQTVNLQCRDDEECGRTFDTTLDLNPTFFFTDK
jgi:hypothetical protein